MIDRHSFRFVSSRLSLAAVLALMAPAASAQPAPSAWPQFHRDAARSGRSAAVSLATPQVRWTFSTGDSIIASSPVIGPDGAVYVGADDGRLYAVNANGTLRWSFLAGGALRYGGPALAADGTVYVGSMDSSLYAVTASGTLRWKAKRGSTFRSSPLILPDGDVVAGNGDNNLYRFTAAGAPSGSPRPWATCARRPRAVRAAPCTSDRTT